MTQRDLIIFGTGELAEVAAFYFDHDGRRVIAFTADSEHIPSINLPRPPGHPVCRGGGTGCRRKRAMRSSPSDTQK